MVGVAVVWAVGAFVGSVGALVGASVDAYVGAVGPLVGTYDGAFDGAKVVGDLEGVCWSDGVGVGAYDGEFDGAKVVGDSEGALDAATHTPVVTNIASRQRRRKCPGSAILVRQVKF